MARTTEEYDGELEGNRRVLAADPIMVALFAPDIDPRVLGRYLIQFCALGVQLTRPMDRWIHRAGERCCELGLRDIGQSLVRHSTNEGGRHLMLMDDTRMLVNRWNERGLPVLDAERLIASPPTPAIEAFVSLNEDTIASDMPYGQVAIELEIERMSNIVGPRLLGRCKQVLGPDLLRGLSFIDEHVALDVGHTTTNQQMLGRLLSVRPDALPRLAEIAAAALRVYVRFFGECLSVAQKEVARLTAKHVD